MNSGTKPESRKTGRLVAKNLIILLVLVAVCAFSIWSWFTSNPQATAKGISVTAETPKNLEMSLDLTDEKVFSNVVKLEDAKYDENTKIVDRVILDDITGDGYTFCLPDMTQNGDGATPNVSSDAWQFNLDGNTTYFSLTATFKTNFPANIYIAKGTEVSTEYEDNNDTTLPESEETTKDAIAGAVRVSVVKEKATEASFIWIPRPDIFLDYSDAADSPKITILNSEDAMSTNGTNVHQYYNSSKKQVTYASDSTYAGAAAFTVEEGSYPADGAESPMCVATATTANEADGYYYCTATINIWIEGCDAETRRVLSDGKFNLNLKFVAEEIE